MNAQLVCSGTGKRYAAGDTRWLGESGHLLDLEFNASFDPAEVAARSPDLWRYREALPVNGSHIISMQEGFTPLLPFDLKGKKVLIKQEQLFSTGSYKDRGAAVMMSRAKELGIKHVVQDSSGNAACSVAAYAAAGGMSCEIFLPENTSPGKVAQIMAYGAAVTRIKGSREDTAEATMRSARSHYYASHCYNPYFFHGTKTFAYEVCEQLGWKVPDALVLPAGNGTLVLGCYIGFTDLMRMGVTDRMPKIIAVQAANCAPLAHAFSGAAFPGSSETAAEGIAIAKPVRGLQIINAVRATAGSFVTVTEEEIKAAFMLCAMKGFYIEPTSAATIAGLEKFIAGSDDATVVSLFSGHGLKATEKIMKWLMPS